MPVSVPLRFQPPSDPNITKLHIYEGSTSDGLMLEIDSTEDVGTYPTYISFYETALANSKTDWFAIQWEDEGGALTDLSEPIQGGTETLIYLVASRVLQRDPSADPVIVYQEAEYAIALVKNTDDPWSLTSEDATVREISGMVYLTMARSYIVISVSQSQSSAYVAGLISEKSTDSNSRNVDIQRLIDLANRDLGWNISVVMLMEDLHIAGAASRWAIDQSRLIREIEIQ